MVGVDLLSVHNVCLTLSLPGGTHFFPCPRSCHILLVFTLFENRKTLRDGTACPAWPELLVGLVTTLCISLRQQV